MEYSLKNKTLENIKFKFTTKKPTIRISQPTQTNKEIKTNFISFKAVV